MMKRLRNAHGQRGTALILGLLVAMIISGLVMVLSWEAGIATEVAGNTVRSDMAFAVAESGAHRAMWYWKHNGYTWNSSGSWTMVTPGAMVTSWAQAYSCTPDSKISGAYDISCTATDSVSGFSQTVSFVATPPTISNPPALVGGGTSGNISGNVKMVGDYVVRGALNGPVNVTGNLTVGGACNSSPTVGGSMIVNGDMNGNVAKVGGDLSVNGTVNSSPQVGGNLTVSGVIWGHPNVKGTTTTKTPVSVTVPSPPDVAGMANTLISQAGKTVSTWSITTIDFTSSPNGIVYISGDANIAANCVVKGSGTVVVSGNWNQSVTFPGSGTANINIVVKGDLNCNGQVNINGSMYGGNNWNQSANFNITGVVAVKGDYNVGGSGTITATAPPSFDNRTGSSSGTSTTSGTIKISGFTGPVL